jgi:hypothetical protein
MAIDWGAAARNNNALAYFAMGQQIGQNIVDNRVGNATSRILTGQIPGQSVPVGQPAPMGAPTGAPTIPGQPGGMPLPPMSGMTPGIGDQHNRDMGKDWATIARYNPQLFGQLQKQQQEQAKLQQEAQQRQILGDALANPDPAVRAAARQKVAYFNSDTYMKLGEDGKKQFDGVMGMIAQQAFSILPLPPEQQGPALQQALATLQRQGIDTSQFKLSGNPEADLRGALAVAGQLDEYEKFVQPNYQPVPRDNTLVNTKDPLAVQEYLGGNKTPPPAAPKIIPQKPAGKTDDQIWAEAHEAVRKGANVDDVFRQLQAWGMKP